MKKKEIKRLDFQRWANGIAVALPFVGFFLLLAALILALGTESEISEDGMEKARRVAEGRSKGG